MYSRIYTRYTEHDPVCLFKIYFNFFLKFVSQIEFKSEKLIQAQRNWFFATNSNFLILIFIKLDVVDLGYFFLLHQIIYKIEISTVYNIRLQIYRDFKIRVYGKHLIHLCGNSHDHEEGLLPFRVLVFLKTTIKIIKIREIIHYNYYNTVSVKITRYEPKWKKDFTGA